MKPRGLAMNERGVAAVEMALALPVLVVMLYMFVQLGEVYRAMSGIQQALGQGARYATLCLNPDNNGCQIPSGQAVHDEVMASVYGIGPGSFSANVPTLQNDAVGTGHYYDLTVTYTQATTLLFFPGPTINVTRSKRVWVAGS